MFEAALPKDSFVEDGTEEGARNRSRFKCMLQDLVDPMFLTRTARAHEAQAGSILKPQLEVMTRCS